MFKFLFRFLVLASFCLVFSSCITVGQPFFSPSSKIVEMDYEVLGFVSKDFRDVKIFGLGASNYRHACRELLEAAKSIYPECNYVKDIYLDKRISSFLGIYTSVEYGLTGVAIRVKDTKGNSLPQDTFDSLSE